MDQQGRGVVIRFRVIGMTRDRRPKELREMGQRLLHKAQSVDMPLRGKLKNYKRDNAQEMDICGCS